MSIVDDLQEFFFEAMLEGWVAGAAKQQVLDKPGYKRFIHESGGWQLIDEYCVHPYSRYSAGTTTIWIAGFIAWVMQYQGWYTKEGSKLAKAALMEAYSEKLWLGGRGPNIFEGAGLRYINEAQGDFRDFYGHEVVVSNDDEVRQFGRHSYQGTWFNILEG